MAGDLPSLMALRVQGIATPERAAAALGIDPDGAKQRLVVLVAAGLAIERTGRLAGFTLTPAGVDAFDKLLADEGLRTSEGLRECYDRFMGVDPVVKTVCTRSQTEGPGAALDELVELHDRTRVCLRKIIALAPRYAPYLERLDDCVRRLQDGDTSAFTKPLAESYHQVWWELHQDLLLTLGLERDA